MVAVITDNDRKYLKRKVTDDINKLQARKDELKELRQNYVKATYEANDSQQLYGKSADDYKADLDAQFNFVQTEIDRLQNIKQYLTEIVIA